MPIKFGTDLDDVIVPFVPSISAFTHREYQITAGYEDFTSFEFAEIWGLTVEECDEILDAYFASDDFLEIEPRTDAVIGLNSLNFSGVDLSLITSRHNLIREHTRKWIKTKFPDVFTNICFSSNVHTDRASGKTKAEILHELGITHFAEDSAHYAPECAEVCEVVYLFRHPWNRDLILPKNVMEVDTWYEVTAHIRSIIT